MRAISSASSCSALTIAGVASAVSGLAHLVALVVVAQHEQAIAERGLGGGGAGDQVGVARCRQLAGTVDAALARRVAAAAEQEQRGCSG
jgi:hypothetical protein